MLKFHNKSSQAQGNKIEEKAWKIKVWNACAQNVEKFDFRKHLSLPKTSFFRDFDGKNEDGFLQHKSKQKHQQTDLPNPPQS